LTLGEISGSHGGEYEDTVFWDVVLCSLVEIYQHFRGASASIITHCPDDGGSKNL
jgi:hypothetical protein